MSVAVEIKRANGNSCAIKALVKSNKRAKEKHFDTKSEGSE